MLFMFKLHLYGEFFNSFFTQFRIRVIKPSMLVQNRHGFRLCYTQTRTTHAHNDNEPLRANANPLAWRECDNSYTAAGWRGWGDNDWGPGLRLWLWLGLEAQAEAQMTPQQQNFNNSVAYWITNKIEYDKFYAKTTANAVAFTHRHRRAEQSREAGTRRRVTAIERGGVTWGTLWWQHQSDSAAATWQVLERNSNRAQIKITLN